jgi:hypothetical protein
MADHEGLTLNRLKSAVGTHFPNDPFVAFGVAVEPESRCETEIAWWADAGERGTGLAKSSTMQRTCRRERF